MLRMGLVAGCIVAVAGAVFMMGSTAVGQGDAAGIKKIADLVKKGDMDGAKAAAAAYAKKNSDLDDLMGAFKPAKKKGLGVTGSDLGIEQTLVKMGRDVPPAAGVAKLADAYEEMGYNIAAIGLITKALAPEKDAGKKTKKDWNEWSDGMIEAGQKIAAAAKSKSPADLKTHAMKANNNCNSCHSTFR